MMRLVILMLTVFIILTACTAPDPTPTPTELVVGITVVASPRVTSTDLDATPSAQTTIERIADCPDAPPIRLIVQERGRVLQDDNRPLNLRDGPGTSFDIIATIEPGETFFVLDGPECNEVYTWFRVQYRGRTGWIAEGDSESYYVEPYLPG